ncbi:MAG: VC0807 family protein [Bacteroidota bacterium]
MLKKIFNRRTLTDLIIYLGIPLVIWNSCRGILGDYPAMLASTVPGIVYTFYTFFKEKQYSLTGLFFITTMLIGSIMDVYSKTAIQMLWNDVYINVALVIFWCFTILIRRPMAMYFFIDYAYLHGIPKERSKPLYSGMPFFRYFMLLTGYLALQDLSDIFLRIGLIHIYGVNGFNTIKMISQVWGTATTALFVYFIILIIKRIQHHSDNQQNQKQ